jgi:hypothetical protein
VVASGGKSLLRAISTARRERRQVREDITPSFFRVVVGAEGK